MSVHPHSRINNHKVNIYACTIVNFPVTGNYCFVGNFLSKKLTFSIYLSILRFVLLPHRLLFSLSRLFLEKARVRCHILLFSARYINMSTTSSVINYKFTEIFNLISFLEHPSEIFINSRFFVVIILKLNFLLQCFSFNFV